MAGGTLLRDVTMLEDEGALLFHVTAAAGLTGGTPLEETFLPRPVDVVAVDADHLPLPHGVMGQEPVFLFDIGMTGITKGGHLLAIKLLTRAGVEAVAVEATHIVQGMAAGIPESQDGG